MIHDLPSPSLAPGFHPIAVPVHSAIVVIDTGLPDWTVLRDGVSCGSEVVLIESGTDGLDRLVQSLADHSGIAAIHVMAHGFPGGLQLGTARLDKDSLASRGADWAAIAGSLAPGAQIALYSCETASGDGPAFLAGLEAITGAAIAASTTLTGAAWLGGDWDLSYRPSGNAPGVPLTGAARQAYAHVMTPTPPTYSSAAGYISDRFFEMSFDQALDAANPPATSSFDVQINGTGTTVSAVSISGTIVRVTFTANALTAGDIIEFSYQDPTGGNDVSAIQGTAGTDAATFSSSTIVVGGRPSTAPSLSATGSSSVFAQGEIYGNDLFSSITANTNDTGQTITGFTLTVTNVADTTEYIRQTAFGPSIALTHGATGSFGGGTASVSVSGATATVTVTGASSTASAFQMMLDSLDYFNSDSTVTAGTRTFALTRITDSGASNNTTNLTGITATVTVTAADTTPPAAPVITSGSLTNDTTPAITGTAEAGSTVTLTVAGATYTTIATAGVWSIDLGTATPLSGTLALNLNGTNAVSVTARDAASNVSTPASQTLTVDSTMPGLPAITSPAITNDTTPAIAGTAEAGSTVTVIVAGATYTTIATGGVWSIDLGTTTPVSGTLAMNLNGANAVSVTARDAASNVSTPATQTLTIDSTVPGQPTITSPAITNDTAPEIAGTAEAGSTVTVIVAGATYTTIATGGVWSIDLGTATPVTGMLALNLNGTNAVSVTATDTASNVSAAATQTLTLDTSLPGMPAITSPAITNDTTPAISGTAEAGSAVTVTVAGATYTTVATAGVWSIDLGTATPASGTLALNLNGSNAVSVTARDAASNVSTPATQTLTVDSTMPTGPGITSPALTNDTTPVISGTAEAGSTVTVTVAGATYTTIATGGVWSIDLGTATPVSGTLALNPNGTNAVSVTATDAASNVSTPTSQTLTVDSTVPGQPTITSPAITNDTAPEIAGTAEAGSTVTVIVAGATYTTIATGGVWSIDLGTATPVTGTLALNLNGTNAVSVTATDTASNVSAAATQTLTLDTSLPGVPAITSPSITNDTTPAIAGTAEAGSTVTVTVAGATYTTIATAGVWSIDLGTATPASGTLALNPNGTNAVSATARDAASNVSTPATQTLTIDTTAPVAPSIQALPPASDSGLLGDGITNNARPTLVGTGEPFGTISITGTIGGVSLGFGTTTVDAYGNWTYVPPSAVPDGVYTVTVTLTDAAGNVSPVSAPRFVAIDTTLPAAPAITSPALTNDTTPTITGTAEAGSTVTVTVAGATYTTIATGGVWSIDLGVATPVTGTLALNPNGTNTVSATAKDTASNVSAAATQTLTLDTSLPGVPAITSPSITNDTTPAITGTAEAGSTVTVTVAGATYTTFAAAGVWSLDLGTATPASGTLALNLVGSNAVSATARDAAGNVSVPVTQSLSFDTVAPAAPTITSPTLTRDATPTIGGTAEAGSTVTVTVAGATYTTVATGGAWSVDLGTATPVSGTLALNRNGNNAVSATARDVATNLSSPATQTLTVDTLVPTTPSDLVLAPASDTGTLGDNITSKTTPTLTGTGGEPGSTITLTDTRGGSAVVLGTALVGDSGRWSFVPPVALAAGAHGISVTATDLAGNTSPASAPLALLLYPTAPGAPTLVSQAPRSGSQQPVLSGTGVAGNTVLLFDGGGQVGAALVGPDGRWSFTYPMALAVGSYTVTAKASDPAGNLSAASAPVTVAVVADGSYTVAANATDDTIMGQVYDPAGVLTTLTKSTSAGLLLQTVSASTALRNIYNDQGVLIGTISQAVGDITAQPAFESTGQRLAATSTTSSTGSIITFTAQTNVITTLGSDTVFANGDSSTIFATGPRTMVVAGYGALTFIAGDGLSTVTGGTGSTTAFGGAGGGELRGGTAGHNVLVSNGGSTTLIGGGASDVLVAGSGTTTIVMQAGSTAFGGTGDTTMFGADSSVLVGGSGRNVMVGGPGSQEMWGGSGTNEIWGGTGRNVLGAGAGTTTMAARSGDNIFVGGTGRSTAYGGSGSDTYFTGPGHMDIIEGAGQEKIVFGSGSASTASGSGSDLYIFTNGFSGGTDVIAGFTVGQDHIQLFGYDLTTVQTQTTGGNTNINLSDGTKIILLGLTVPNATSLF